jgi:hypothetical protein
VFASEGLMPLACDYLHDWREQGLSDHSALEADFEQILIAIERPSTPP